MPPEVPPDSHSAPGAPEWASEIIRKLDVIWKAVVEDREERADLSMRVRSLEATRDEQDRLRKLEGK